MTRNIEVIKKDFKTILLGLSGSRRPYEIFSDWLEMSAISFYQIPYHAGDFEKDDTFQSYEEKYLAVAKKYNPKELSELSKLAGLTIEGLNTKFHDFLGGIYQEMEFINERTGQFFTPYVVSSMMAKMQTGNIKQLVEEKGIITIADHACGAGGMLIAAAQEAFHQGVDPRQFLQFDAIDIDRDCFNMTYIQLSVLDLQAIVHHGNSLSMEMWEHRPTPQMMYFQKWLQQKREEQEKLDKLRNLFLNFDNLTQENDDVLKEEEEELIEVQKIPEPDIILNPKQLSLFDMDSFG